MRNGATLLGCFIVPLTLGLRPGLVSIPAVLPVALSYKIAVDSRSGAFELFVFIIRPISGFGKDYLSVRTRKEAPFCTYPQILSSITEYLLVVNNRAPAWIQAPGILVYADYEVH
jgi:hypothetical protein